MRIVDKELERIMRDYRASKNKTKRLSKGIPTDEERAELIKKYLEPPKKVKLSFIVEPSESYYTNEFRQKHKFEQNKSGNKIRFIETVKMDKQKRLVKEKSTNTRNKIGKNRTEPKKRDIARHSGIEAFGDSGREFRKEDWNDEIARNFKKELKKTRAFRSQMGWIGVDRGALK